MEGLSSVGDSLLPRSEGELHEALREGDLQAVKLQNAITQQVEKITAQDRKQAESVRESPHYVYIYWRILERLHLHPIRSVLGDAS